MNFLDIKELPAEKNFLEGYAQILVSKKTKIEIDNFVIFVSYELDSAEINGFQRSIKKNRELFLFEDEKLVLYKKLHDFRGNYLEKFLEFYLKERDLNKFSNFFRDYIEKSTKNNLKDFKKDIEIFLEKVKNQHNLFTSKEYNKYFLFFLEDGGFLDLQNRDVLLSKSESAVFLYKLNISKIEKSIRLL